MLQVRLPGNQGDLHIRDRSAGQDAPVDLFLQVSQDQPLPVQGQVVRGHVRAEDQAAPGRQRFQPQVDLRVMAQRLIVPNALHRFRDGLPIQHAGLPEGDLQPEPILHLPAQDLQVHLAHSVWSSGSSSVRVMRQSSTLCVSSPGPGITRQA